MQLKTNRWQPVVPRQKTKERNTQMAARFFGQFLIEKKVISGLNLIRAIELQEKSNHRFGDLVLEMGLMTEEQIYLTHRAQRHEDLQFGDMAVKLGFLTSAQVKHVLDNQQQRHLYIGEALVKIGAVTPEKLEVYLAEFKQIGKTGDSGEIEIPEHVPHREIWRIFADMTFKMLTRIAGATFRIGSCSPIRTIPPAPLAYEVELTEATTARYILTMSDESQKLIAATTLKKKTSAPAEDIETTVCKFVNIICGNAISQAAKQAFNMTSRPAFSCEINDDNRTIPDDSIALLFPIYLSDGNELNLILVIKEET
jgi:CheY-specific phosphatase CheX